MVFLNANSVHWGQSDLVQHNTIKKSFDQNITTSIFLSVDQ